MLRPIPKRAVTWGTGSPPSKARTACRRCSHPGRAGCKVVSMGMSSSCRAHDSMVISQNTVRAQSLEPFEQELRTLTIPFYRKTPHNAYSICEDAIHAARHGHHRYAQTLATASPHL